MCVLCEREIRDVEGVQSRCACVSPCATRHLSPSRMSCMASVQPRITWLGANVVGEPRAIDESNTVPSMSLRQGEMRGRGGGALEGERTRRGAGGAVRQTGWPTPCLPSQPAVSAASQHGCPRAQRGGFQGTAGDGGGGRSAPAFPPRRRAHRPS